MLPEPDSVKPGVLYYEGKRFVAFKRNAQEITVRDYMDTFFGMWSWWFEENPDHEQWLAYERLRGAMESIEGYMNDVGNEDYKELMKYLEVCDQMIKAAREAMRNLDELGISSAQDIP